MDFTEVWTAVGAIGTFAAAGTAAWAAVQSRESAKQANAAAGTLAMIEGVITCRKDAQEPWLLPHEVEIPPDPVKIVW